MIKINDNQSITSLKIAEISRKPHADVLKSIRQQEIAWIKIDQGKFSLISYKDKYGRSQKMYLLNYDESLYIASKYDDETRARIIKHWSELRSQHSGIIDLQKVILPAIAEVGTVSAEVDSLYFKLSENPDFIRYNDLLERKTTLNKVIKEYQKAIQITSKSKNILDT